MASKSSRSRIVFILMSIFFRVIVNTKIQPLPSDISLIYGEYQNHKLYCKFATMQVIEKSVGLVEEECFKKFKDMTQTLPDGNVTHPYLKYGAVEGRAPSCEELKVENGKVGTCYPGSKIRFVVNTVCNYSCDPGFIATSPTVTCRLMVSQKNMSFQWWKDTDIFNPENMDSEYCKQLSIRNGKVGVCLKDSKNDPSRLLCNYSCDPGFLATNSNGNFHFEIGNKYSFQRIKDKDLCIGEPAVEPLVQEPENFTKPLAVLIPSVCVVIAIVIIALPCTRRKLKVIFSESTSLQIEDHDQDNGAPCSADLTADAFPEVPDEKKENQSFNQNQAECEKANDPTERSTQRKDSSPEEREQLLPDAFPEVPDEKKENQSFNQNQAECEKVGNKKIPGTDPELEQCLAVLGEPLKNDLTSALGGSSCHLEFESLNSRKENHQCVTDVRLLLDNTNGQYRLKLQGELEIIRGRRRDQALVGYVVKNREALGFPSENSIKLQEETYKDKIDEKVSVFLLRTMSHHGHTIGMMLDYFAE